MEDPCEGAPDIARTVIEIVHLKYQIRSMYHVWIGQKDRRLPNKDFQSHSGRCVIDTAL